MNIYKSSIKEALEKDLILAYLRKNKNRLINILELRDKVFYTGFPFEKVRQYAEEFKKDQLISKNKNNPSEVGYIPDETFFDLGGHIKKLFETQKIEYNATSLVEAHHKDLILYYLVYINKQQLTHLTDLDDLQMIFPTLDNIKFRYYIDGLRNDGYIDSMGNDDYIFRYYPASDSFLEEGGYTGLYIGQLLEVIERRKLIEEEQLSPKELAARRRLNKRKDYVENMKTGFLYFSLKYGWIILLGLILILLVLIKIGVITEEKAISFVTWIIDRIK